MGITCCELPRLDDHSWRENHNFLKEKFYSYQDITRTQEKLCAECYDPNYVERKTFSWRFFSLDIKLNIKIYIANCESCTCILISKLTVYIKNKISKVFNQKHKDLYKALFLI